MTTLFYIWNLNRKIACTLKNDISSKEKVGDGNHPFFKQPFSVLKIIQIVKFDSKNNIYKRNRTHNISIPFKKTNKQLLGMYTSLCDWKLTWILTDNAKNKSIFNCNQKKKSKRKIQSKAKKKQQKKPFPLSCNKNNLNHI